MYNYIKFYDKDIGKFKPSDINIYTPKPYKQKDFNSPISQIPVKSFQRVKLNFDKGFGYSGFHKKVSPIVVLETPSEGKVPDMEFDSIPYYKFGLGNRTENDILISRFQAEKGEHNDFNQRLREDAGEGTLDEIKEKDNNFSYTDDYEKNLEVVLKQIKDKPISRLYTDLDKARELKDTKDNLDRTELPVGIEKKEKKRIESLKVKAKPEPIELSDVSSEISAEVEEEVEDIGLFDLFESEIALKTPKEFNNMDIAEMKFYLNIRGFTIPENPSQLELIGIYEDSYDKYINENTGYNINRYPTIGELQNRKKSKVADFLADEGMLELSQNEYKKMTKEDLIEEYRKILRETSSIKDMSRISQLLQRKRDLKRLGKPKNQNQQKQVRIDDETSFQTPQRKSNKNNLSQTELAKTANPTDIRNAFNSISKKTTQPNKPNKNNNNKYTFEDDFSFVDVYDDDSNSSFTDSHINYLTNKINSPLKATRK